jgi:3-oxoadipate enol-lactonase
MKTSKKFFTDDSLFINNKISLAYSLFHLNNANSRRKKIVLIHSLAMTRKFWQLIATNLVEYADILTYDVRGHGESSLNGSTFTHDLFADDLSNLLNYLGWGKVVVAGASMGGCISLAFAVKYPNRTSGLGMIDSTSWYGEDANEKWRERADKAIKNGMSSLVEFQKSRWFSDKFRDENSEKVFDAISIFEKNDVNAFANTCKMMGDFDLRDKLQYIKIPVSILVGEEDYATPVQMSEFLNQSISNSTLKIIKGKRHLTPIECPEVICEELINLLQKSTNES